MPDDYGDDDLLDTAPDDFDLASLMESPHLQPALMSHVVRGRERLKQTFWEETKIDPSSLFVHFSALLELIFTLVISDEKQLRMSQK